MRVESMARLQDAELKKTILPLRFGASHWMAGLLIFAFVLRLGVLALITGLHTAPAPGTDECEYDIYAWNVAQGNGYRGPSPNVADENHLTAYRAPAPSLFLAGLYFLVGHNHAAAYFANTLLGALTVWLVFQITLKCFNERAAWLAAVFYACYPIAIYYGLTLNSEIFSTFVICLFVWCCLGIQESAGMAWAIGAGITLGIVLLSKPGFVFLLPLLPLWAWSVCGKQRVLWKRIFVVPVLTGFLLAPWLIRNVLVMHAFIPFSTGGGSLLLQANNRQVVEDPSYAGYAVFDFSLPEYAQPILRANDEVKRDAIAKRFAVQWLRDNRDKWFYLLRSKFIRLWRTEYTGNHYHDLAWVLTLMYGSALLAFSLSVVAFTKRMLRQRKPGSIMICMILATVVSALIFHGQHRYRFPIDGFCICIGAGGAVLLWELLRRRSVEDWFGAIGEWARRRWMQGTVACMLVLGLALWCRADNRHIEAWRNAECQNRLVAISQAAVAYRKVHGVLPPRLSLLVPQFLPNLEALHCPKDTISYTDHALLPMTDAEPYQRLISYSCLPPQAPGGEPCIVEVAVHHGDALNAVTLSGKLFRFEPASPVHGSIASN